MGVPLTRRTTEAKLARLKATLPVERWSARMLVEEVKRLRSAVATSPDPFTDAERAQARVREAELLNELAAARAAAPRGIAGDQVAGKPALAEFRKETWEDFADAVMRLPAFRRKNGLMAVRAAIATDLDADLHLLGLTRPSGTIASRERDSLRRLLDARPFNSLLSRPEPWTQRLRLILLSHTARAYYRPSVWAAFDRSSEVPRKEER